MVVRLFLVGAALAATVIGFLLPLPGRDERPDARSQVASSTAARS